MPLENQGGKSETRLGSIVIRDYSQRLPDAKFIVIRRAEEALALAFAG